MLYSTSIGIDTHQYKNTICALIRETGEIATTTLSADPGELVAWIRKKGFPAPVRCCYESGPTGFGLARALRSAGVDCVVAATSKLPYRTDRKKNDKVDAEWLARMQVAGSVREVMVPSVGEESLCHLSRLRGEVAADLRRAKQRVASFMLLTETGYTLTRKRWSKAFRSWAECYEFECGADTYVFRMKVSAVYRLEERLAEIEGEILRTIAEAPELGRRMARFLAIHGIGKVTAFTLICEVYDFGRFKNGASFASYVGVVPSENSSGERESNGRITKKGNPHLRRILIEAASVYSRPVKAAKVEGLEVSEAVRAKAEKCKFRLRRKRELLRSKGVKPNKAKVAVARELCEWIYHIAVMPD